MDTKDYWFALKSYVYAEFKTDMMLLYDTQTGNRIETGYDKAVALIKQMYEPANLGVTLFGSELQKDVEIMNFVRETLDKQMGDLIDSDKFKTKPVRLIPILNLQRDVDKINATGDVASLTGKDILNYLLEVNIYLNEVCDLGCLQCQKYCKQVRCCTVNNSNGKELPAEKAANIFRQISHSAVGRINILGGNILNYGYIDELRRILSSLDKQFHKIIHYYVHYENYTPNELIKSSNLELIVNFPVNETTFKHVYSLVDSEKTNINFIVENEAQYAEAEKLIETVNIENYMVVPVYTGDNFDFFEENLFLDKEDIFLEVIPMRKIFRNQKLNSNYFGTMYILPDGNVKANINTESIGNIDSNSILNLLYKEITDNTAWRKIRNTQPCSECLYQYFCPAPSDYERIMGRENLCRIVNDNY